MADVAVAVQSINRVAGLAPTYTGSLSTGDTYVIPNDGRVFLHAKKSGAGACTVTVDTPGSVDDLAIAQRTFSVPATTGDIMHGPYPTAVYGTSLRVTLSEVTGLTLAAVRL